MRALTAAPRLVPRVRCIHAGRARAFGQAPEDHQMGERAAKRTNETLSKISDMYVGKNFGYSKQSPRRTSPVLQVIGQQGHGFPVFTVG